MMYSASAPLRIVLLSPPVASQILPSTRSPILKVWIRITTFQHELIDDRNVVNKIIEEINYEIALFLFESTNSQGAISEKALRGTTIIAHSKIKNGKHSHRLVITNFFHFLHSSCSSLSVRHCSPYHLSLTLCK